MVRGRREEPDPPVTGPVRKINIDRLREGLAAIPKWKEARDARSSEFETWNSRATQSLGAVFGKGHDYYRTFSFLSFCVPRTILGGGGRPWAPMDVAAFDRDIAKAESLLIDALSEIDALEGVAGHPGPPKPIAQDVGTILRRFRQCCRYLANPLASERDVQDVLWIMLRSHFDRIDREDTLKRFGVKKYVPDFGIPELTLLIEVKFIGEATKPSDIQEELLADVPGYLQAGSGYKHMLAFVYDAAHKLLDERKFRDDLLGILGIIDVIVVPGIG